MGLLKWLHHDKQKNNESYKSNVSDTSSSTLSDDSSHKRTFKPIKKKERLRFDKNSDGTLKVTIPADRSYHYEKEQIKNGTYDSEKARERRNANYKSHLTYGPILNNDRLMEQIRNNMITDKIRVSPRRYDIKGRYNETVTNEGMNGQSSTVNGRNQTANNSSRATVNAQTSRPKSQSAQPTRVSSHPGKMSSVSPQETKNIVQNLQAHNRLNSHPAKSASVVAPKNSTSSSASSSSSMSWIMKRHSELASRASSAKQADVRRAMALKSTAERKTRELSQATSRSASISQSISASTSTVASLKASISASYSMSYRASYAASMSSSASSHSKAIYYKKSKAIQSKRQSLINSFDNSAGVNASPASSTHPNPSYANNVNYINVQTSTVSGLNYSQQLMSKFSSESLSAAQSLANRRQEYFKQLKEVRKNELMRERVKQIKRKHHEEEEERRRKEKISRLKASAAQIEDQIAVYDGSQGSKVRSAARSASASKSASVSASQAHSYASASASNKSSYARKESLLNIAIRQANSSAAVFKKRLKSTRKRFKSTQGHLKQIKSQNVNRLKAANASVNVLRKQLKKQLRNDGSNKKLIRRYNRLLKNSVSNANKVKRQLLSNKKALNESSQKNQQLVEASKNNTDVLKAMSKLSVNYKKASGQIKAYKRQVQVYKNKAANMQLVVQKHKKNAVMNPNTIKQIQTLRLNNKRLKTALHRYYINNISGRKKNAKLRKVIESMQRNARHNSNNRIENASASSSASRYDRTAQLPNDSDTHPTYTASSGRPKLNGKFKPTHHNFTREGKLASDRYHQELSKASQDNSYNYHSRVERNNERYNNEGSGMLNGLFHNHEQETSADYYQSNEVHSNQRIFLLGKIVENTGNEKNVYRTGSKYYTLGLIPGATGEEYKTRFVLPTGHAIPARKRLVKLI